MDRDELLNWMEMQMAVLHRTHNRLNLMYTWMVWIGIWWSICLGAIIGLLYSHH